MHGIQEYGQHLEETKLYFFRFGEKIDEIFLFEINTNTLLFTICTYKQPNNPMSKAVEFGFLSIKVKTSSLQFGHCVRIGYGPKIKFTVIFIFCLFWRMA